MSDAFQRPTQEEHLLVLDRGRLVFLEHGIQRNVALGFDLFEVLLSLPLDSFGCLSRHRLTNKGIFFRFTHGFTHFFCPNFSICA